MIVLFCLSAARVEAQETGIVTGTVFNAGTQKALERAVVTVSGTNLSARTERDGSYRVIAVPAGNQTLVVSYTGLDDASETVTVVAGRTARLDFSLGSDVYVLDEFSVAAEPEGVAYAIQQQQHAESLRSIVSADAFGTITDANPGEFLKSMPGIQMDYTGIEPRRAFIRGLEPNLNRVLLNGNQMAAAASSGADRVFEFDQITLDNIESIEVYKAPIPSMPANAIGGTINMVTRSAFLQKGRRIRATLNLNANSEDMSLGGTSGPDDGEKRKVVPGGTFMYSNSFFDNRLGVVLSLSSTNLYGNGGTAYDQMTYVNPPGGDYTNASPAAYVRQYQREDHTNYNERKGVSLNLDYKVSDNTTAYLRTTFNDHVYLFRNRFLTANNGGNVAPGFSATFVEGLGGAASTSQQNLSFGDKLSSSWMINPGVRHKLGAWTVDYDIAYSRGKNRYENVAPGYFSGVNIVLPDVGFTLAKTDDASAVNTFTQTSGPSVFDLANYRPDSGNFASTSERSGTDTISSGKISARRDFSTERPFYLEAGAAYQKQERDKERPNRRWSYVGPDGLPNTPDDTTEANLAQFAAVGYDRPIAFGERGPDQWISAFKLFDYYRSNPGAFVESLPYAYEQAYVNRQSVEEKIVAGYIMGNLTLGKLDVLAGLRLESTKVSGEGARRDNSLVPDGVDPGSLEGMMAKYTRMRASASYTSDPFNYLHFTYHVSDRLQARASYTEAMGRPNFGTIIPGATIEDGARTISLNNTELEPQRSQNYDLSVEYYAGAAGFVSASWFKKDIEDYINTNTTTLSTALPEFNIGAEYIGYALTTQENLGSATIEGFELGFQRRLPGALKSVEVFGNFTRLYKTEGTFGSSAAAVVDRLPSTAAKFWNLGASFRTPDRRLFFMIKANFVDDVPLNLSPTRRVRDDRLVLDAEVRYKLNPHFELSLAGRNVGDVTEGESEVGHGVRTGTGGGIAFALTLGINY